MVLLRSMVIGITYANSVFLSPKLVIFDLSNQENLAIERRYFIMIYFIQAGENGPIKIGYTEKSPYKRLNSLQVGNHEELTLIAIMPGGERSESELHKRFEYAHKRGEWFYPTLRLIRFINSPENKKVKGRTTIKKINNTLLPKRGVEVEREVLTLWENGIKSIKEITRTVYSSDGGNQRKKVKHYLKINGKI